MERSKIEQSLIVDIPKIQPPAGFFRCVLQLREHTLFMGNKT